MDLKEQVASFVILNSVAVAVYVTGVKFLEIRGDLNLTGLLTASYAVGLIVVVGYLKLKGRKSR